MASNTLKQGETVKVALIVACSNQALAKIGEIEGQWSSCLKLNLDSGQFIGATVHITRSVP
jgi:hypothetical protein